MRFSVWHRSAAIMLLLGCILGCGVPTTPSTPALTVAAARSTLDSWNPNYSKVVEFFGLYQPADSGGAIQVAYVLLANPSAASQKPMVYTARFTLLTLPDNQKRWFLTSLVTHSEGVSRRQGWDNLIIPVKSQAPSEPQ